MSLADRFSSAPEPTQAPRRVRSATMNGFETGVRIDERDGSTVATTPDLLNRLADEEAWRAAVEELGISVPDGYSVQLVEMRHDPAAWHRDEETSKAVTRPVWRYRFKVQPASPRVDVSDLVARVTEARTTTRQAAGSDDNVFVFALGDTQFGKVDGDGVEGTLQRVLDSTDRALDRLDDLRALGHRPKAVYLSWLGDCIEGFQSQGGNNAWRTPMTLTEQVRLVRRVMLEQVNLFREHTDNLCLLSVPGNHDEAHRFNGKGITRYDDSWAVESAVAVHDAMQVNSAAYGHVAVQVPGRDELTLTLDLAGTITGFSHGHQARVGKMMDWWAGQAHGLQPIGDATLLLTAHLHHLRLEQSGAKTWLQVPALEGDSAWWRHRTGQKAPPGAVTMLVGQGGWSDLALV